MSKWRVFTVIWTVSHSYEWKSLSLYLVFIILYLDFLPEAIMPNEYKTSRQNLKHFKRLLHFYRPKCSFLCVQILKVVQITREKYIKIRFIDILFSGSSYFSNETKQNDVLIFPTKKKYFWFGLVFVVVLLALIQRAYFVVFCYSASFHLSIFCHKWKRFLNTTLYLIRLWNAWNQRRWIFFIKNHK